MTPIIAERLRVRRAVPDDSADILAWRNDPVSRSVSANIAAVSQDGHEKWFAATLANPDRLIVVGETNVKVGMVRFDRDGRLAVVSVNLNPASRGLGLGTSLLIEAESLVLDWNLTALAAAIRTDNQASVKAFTRAGYMHDGQQADHGFLRFIKRMQS